MKKDGKFNGIFQAARESIGRKQKTGRRKNMKKAEERKKQ